MTPEREEELRYLIEHNNQITIGEVAELLNAFDSLRKADRREEEQLSCIRNHVSANKYAAGGKTVLPSDPGSRLSDMIIYLLDRLLRCA